MSNSIFRNNLINRLVLEFLLCLCFSFRRIADILNCSPSTVQREINNYSKTIPSAECHRANCSIYNLSGCDDCSELCGACIQCPHAMGNYKNSTCEYFRSNNYLCNGCIEFNKCTKIRRIYNAKKAYEESIRRISTSHMGHHLTEEERHRINELVCPLVKNGLSLYSITETYHDILPISQSTLRRMVADSSLDVRNIDLPCTVQRKRGKKNAK